jgi:hypothetical protein
MAKENKQVRMNLPCPSVGNNDSGLDISGNVEVPLIVISEQSLGYSERGGAGQTLRCNTA